MISIDVTNSTMYALCGRQTADGIAIDAFRSAPLSRQVSPDDPKALADDVAKLLDGMKEKAAVIQFSEQETASHRYEFPYESKPAAMLNVVRSGITQNTQDFVMDYAVLDTFPREGAAFCTVQVYLAPRRLVEFAYKALSLAGKKPRGFQVAENCLYGLQHVGFGFGGDVIAASIGGARVCVTLLHGQPGVLTRSAPVMPEAEAFSRAFSGDYPAAFAVGAAAEQISKMMQFQAIKQPGKPVDHIYIFGDYASREAAGSLSPALARDVGVLLRPGYITAPEGFPFERYAYAAGALVESAAQRGVNG